MRSGSIIPIIDIASISTTEDASTSSPDWARVAAQLELSLATVGFVYLTNHGIDPKIVDLAFEKSTSFFELPDDTKLKYLKGASAATGVKEYHGYAPPSKEILSPDVTAELRESFDMDRKMVAGDKYPNAEVPGFQSALSNLEFECRPLITRILKLLAIALKLEDVDFFVRVSKCIKDPLVPSYTAFRSNYYPPVKDGLISDTAVNESIVRCGEHTDYGIITLLFQDCIGGLEIKPGAAQQGTDSGWINVPPIPGTVLLNTGDMLEFWSGGRFPATWHRVRVPRAAVQRRLHRQSIVYFLFPDDEAKISSLVHGHEQDKMKTAEGKSGELELSAYEYATARISKSYKY